jgi:chromosome segregation ATPase
MSPVFDEPRQPTEEDLLYLLMARARHKDEELHRAGQLEEEKERLRVQNQAANANLRRALSLHAESEAQNNTLTQNLTAFKEKYYKLKKWALEANEDCERLSNTTSGLKKSLAEVVRDRDELVSQVYHLRSSSAKATEQLGTLRSHVAIVKSEVQKQSDALSQLYGQYVEQRNHLTDEKNRCRKLDTHIRFLEQENSTRSKRSNLELESLTTRFEEISKKLLQLVRVTEDSQIMNEESFRTGFNILQSIADKDLTTNADLQPIRKALGTVNNTIEAAPKFIINRFQESISTLQKGWQAKASEEASNLLSVTQSGNADLVEAQMQVARLQERAMQYEGILELLTQARNAAEERENQERTENRKTLDELRAFGDPKELKKQITVFQNQVGEFSTRYFAANSALEISKQELDKQQQDIQDLRVTLAKAEQERDSLRNAAAEAEEDMRRCNKQIDEQTKRV